MKKVLYFEGAGWPDADSAGNVGNCRIRTAFTNKNGAKLYLELMSGCLPRIVEKRGKNVTSLVPGKIIVSHCFLVGDPDEKSMNVKIPSMEWSKANILTLVNKKLECDFDEIQVLTVFSGYSVFGEKRGTFNFGDEFRYDPELTAWREYTYHNLANDYFNAVYDQHISENPRAARFKSEYETWGLMCMDANSITVRSHECAELIDEEQRIKTFYRN